MVVVVPLIVVVQQNGAAALVQQYYGYGKSVTMLLVHIDIGIDKPTNLPGVFWPWHAVGVVEVLCHALSNGQC